QAHGVDRTGRRGPRVQKRRRRTGVGVQLPQPALQGAGPPGTRGRDPPRRGHQQPLPPGLTPLAGWRVGTILLSPLSPLGRGVGPPGPGGRAPPRRGPQQPLPPGLTPLGGGRGGTILLPPPPPLGGGVGGGGCLSPPPPLGRGAGGGGRSPRARPLSPAGRG